MEGLFVESHLIKDEPSIGKSGLRKIELSQSLKNIDSPTGEDPIVPHENECEYNPFILLVGIFFGVMLVCYNTVFV